MNSSWKPILICSVSGLCLLFFSVVYFLYNYRFYEVIGDSMSPTLQNRETYLVEKGTVLPKRGDIVAFYYEPNELNYIKRVIGLPGERIEIRSGAVYINNQLLKEPYVHKQEIVDFGPLQIPRGHVFVLGDHRKESQDSREMGPIPIPSIQGKFLTD